MSLFLTVKQIHMGSVLLSFLLFALRGGLMFARVPWQRNVVLRYAPHIVDTVLLTSALFLSSLMQQFPFVHHWLTAKVVALIAYIILGSLALKHARTTTSRAICFVLAVVAFVYIVSVARAHHPYGFFLWL